MKEKKYDKKDVERFFFKKKVTAVLFIVFIMYFFVTSFFNNKHEEIAVNVFGYIQNLLGKNEEADFQLIKDKEGSLHLGRFDSGIKDTKPLADKMLNLKSNIENENTKVIYLMTPDKVLEGITEFDRGLPKDYNNENADDFLKNLSENGIEYIDIRDDILNNSIEYGDVFYKTDTHWKIESVFKGYTYLIDKLNADYHENLDSDYKFRDLENYNTITYKDSYVGSLGRKVGKFYAGLDDFTLIYPKFKTSFDIKMKSYDYELELTGRFEESLLSIENLRNTDLFSPNSDKYSAYLFGNQGYIHVKNNLSTNNKKVLFIKDSLAVPLAAFMTNCVSDVYLIDPRIYDGDITEAVNNISDLDYIFVSFSPQNLSEEFFKF